MHVIAIHIFTPEERETGQTTKYRNLCIVFSSRQWSLLTEYSSTDIKDTVIREIPEIPRQP